MTTTTETNTPATTSTEPVQTEQSPEFNLSDMFSSDFDFDAKPVEPPAPEPSASAEQTAQTPPADGGQQPEPAPVVEGQPQVTTTPAPAAQPEPVKQPDPEVAVLKDLVKTLASQGQQGQQPQQPAQPQQRPPRFNYEVPDALVNALASEDPAERKAGLAAMTNGLANSVYQNIMGDIQKQLLPMIPRMIEHHRQTEIAQKTAHDEFYGEYPELNREEIKPFVHQIGVQLARFEMEQGRTFEWNKENRAKIAQTFRAVMMGGGQPVAQPVMQPPVQQTPPQQVQRVPLQQTPFVAGQGTRPGPAPVNEFMDILF